MGQLYEVEKFIAKRTITQYLTVWKGYSIEESTWENEGNLISCRDLIEEFEKCSLTRDETTNLPG